MSPPGRPKGESSLGEDGAQRLESGPFGVTGRPEYEFDEPAVRAAIGRWIERAVIGLRLCPFAAEPVRQGRLRVVVSTAADADALLRDLEEELQRLRDTPAAELETTLLVHPLAMREFSEFGNFLPIADLSVRMLGLEGKLQVASFHPQYQFADSQADDIENYTNRAPYPCLHLLREDSIAAAVAALDDPDAIYRRNLQTLRRLGHAGWQALWHPATV